MMSKLYMKMFQLCFIIVTANAHSINTRYYTTETNAATNRTTADKLQPTCPPYRFRCDNGECIELNQKCNGRNDCTDGSEEINCIPSSGACADKQFECRITKRCIPHTWTCDGDTDCGTSDMSDEDPITCKISN